MSTARGCEGMKVMRSWESLEARLDKRKRYCREYFRTVHDTNPRHDPPPCRWLDLFSASMVAREELWAAGLK